MNFLKFGFIETPMSFIFGLFGYEMIMDGGAVFDFRFPDNDCWQRTALITIK